MSCSVRGKHIRTSRRLRSSKHFPSLPPPMDISCAAHLTSDASSPIPKSSTDSDPKQSRCHRCSDSKTKIPNHTNPNPNLDESNGWGYCTEEQLEEILMKNLELFYSEAMLKLVALGYDEETASKAILKNGYCNGGMDVMTNILHNALAYLNSSSTNGGGTSVYSSGTGVIGVGCGGPVVSSGQNELVFSDLRQLQEYSLKCMVSLLQQVRPQLSKGDAMWCLLMCDLHVGRASTIEFPFLASARLTTESFNPKSNVETICNSASAVAVPSPPLCRFHGGWGFGNGGVLEFPSNEVSPDIECPKRFNLSPSMKALLKKNVAAFAAGFRANTKHSGPSPSFMAGYELGKECRRIKNQEQVNSVLSKFRDLNLDEKSESVSDNQKDEMIVTLTQQIKDLERQVKERKEWAHQKAMQAARRLCTDLTELKLLRMEMEETQRLKQGKQTLEESTMKRLPEMEDALRKASSQVDRANAAVRRLETENAEIRAEMEASKLSASESVTSCLEVAKREKKCLKRLLAWEKQKTKLQEEIAEEKHKISNLQQELVQLQQDSNEAEVKWRQLLKEKEVALTQVEEEQRAKEATEASNKRKIEALRMKIEVDSQRHKDDLKRLEQDLSRLKASESHTPSSVAALEEPRAGGGGETIARLLNQLDMEESSEINVDRRCLLCKKDEVSVVFLPCAHQVICCKCCDNYGKKGRATCPCCRVLIEQKIRVFGASS